VQKSRRDSRAASSGCAVTPLNETASHGRRELCTLSSAQTLVLIVLILQFGDCVKIDIGTACQFDFSPRHVSEAVQDFYGNFQNAQVRLDVKHREP